VPAVENTAICAGEKITLFVNNPDPDLDYKWYADAAATHLIGSGITYTSSDPLFATMSFFVKAENSSGCTSSGLKQVEVLVIDKPIAPVVDDATVCAGSSATLAIVGPETSLIYRWQDANGTLLHTGTTYTTVPLSSAATFYVTAFTTTRPACASISHAVTVRIMGMVTANTIRGDQSICSGIAPAKLTGSLPSGGGLATLAYQWESSEDNINYVSIVGANTQEYAPAGLTTTTWFRRKVKAAGPCSEGVSNAVRITVAPLPAAPLADDAIVCAGSQASLRIKNPLSAINNITYHWYLTASGGTPVGSGIIFSTPALTASTTYYLEAVQGNGCRSSRQAVLVTVNQSITDNTISSSQTICIGDRPTDLTGSFPNGGNGVFSFQWESSTTGANYKEIAGATGQSYTPDEVLTQTTWYRRKVLTNASCAEQISNAVKIELIPQPTAPTVSHAAICPGNRVTLEAIAMAGLLVEWYDAPEGGNLLFTGSSYRTPVLATTTSFWVQTVNSNSCGSAVRQEAKVLVVPPQVTVSKDITIVEGKPVQLSATGGASYSWTPKTGLSDPEVANPVVRPVETTTYTVTINTKEGCTVVRQVTITVHPRITAANVLTPNGDGFNDNFEIKNIENYPDCQVEIFTRWGEKVFESKGYKEPWNGTKNGNALPMAAYYYIIRPNKNDKPISGSVTIVK
jgi:gliding motility-associated-like protein